VPFALLDGTRKFKTKTKSNSKRKTNQPQDELPEWVHRGRGDINEEKHGSKRWATMRCGAEAGRRRRKRLVGRDPVRRPSRRGGLGTCGYNDKKNAGGTPAVRKRAGGPDPSVALPSATLGAGRTRGRPDQKVGTQGARRYNGVSNPCYSFRGQARHFSGRSICSSFKSSWRTTNLPFGSMSG
jgi:hypothetical protein